MCEKDILNQPLADDDLNEVSGGSSDFWGCTYQATRSIYGGSGFPNCAATVDENSWCNRNDACFNMAVVYTDLKKCQKAFQ